VRVIGPDGEQLGIMPTPQAIELARSQDLDLVEVSPTAKPPVVRLLDYGKFKYEQTRKEREQRKHAKPTLLKEMRLGSVKIDDHDLNTKARTITKFLRAGDKVRVSIRFRGREMTHPELGRQLLDRLVASLAGEGQVEREAAMDGRQMSIILAPRSQSARARTDRAEAGQTVSSEE
jgi:translation initiation factor IF-3